jgi:hypothetical protein
MQTMSRAGGSDAPQSFQGMPAITPSLILPGVYSAYMWKNVAIALWFGPLSLADIPAFEAGCKARCQEHPEGLSMVNIMVPGGKSMPSGEAREELGRIMREYEAHSAEVFVVIQGAGFWASALRGLTTAVSMLAPRYRLHIAANFVQVAELLPEPHRARTGVEIDPKELLRAIRWVESQCKAAAA